MYKVMKRFVCRGCVNPVTGTGRTSVDIGVIANLELVDKFFYLGLLGPDVVWVGEWGWSRDSCIRWGGYHI